MKVESLEDKIKRHVRAYKRARQALECFKAPNEVMDTYRPILPEYLNVSGDVVEENRLGQERRLGLVLAYTGT